MKSAKLFCFLFFLAAFLFGQPGPARALTIGPPLLEANLEAGETVAQKIKLFNETEKPLTIYPALENFLPQPGTGALQFLGDADPAGPARWLKIPVKEVRLKSGEVKDFFVTIKAPETAEPGGYYAALSWLEKNQSPNGISAANRVTHLFLLKIKGAVKEKIEIISLTKEENVGEQFDLRLENSGTVHIKPFGELRINDWRGKRIFTAPVNVWQQSILPQSRRQFLLPGPNDLGWGKYTAEAVLEYGAENKKIAEKKIVFWILPPAWGIKLFGVLLSVLVLRTIYQKTKKKFFL